MGLKGKLKSQALGRGPASSWELPAPRFLRVSIWLTNQPLGGGASGTAVEHSRVVPQTCTFHCCSLISYPLVKKGFNSLVRGSSPAWRGLPKDRWCDSLPSPQRHV